jgi:hypothetical protein
MPMETTQKKSMQKSADETSSALLSTAQHKLAYNLNADVNHRKKVGTIVTKTQMFQPTKEWRALIHTSLGFGVRNVRICRRRRDGPHIHIKAIRHFRTFGIVVSNERGGDEREVEGGRDERK